MVTSKAKTTSAHDPSTASTPPQPRGSVKDRLGPSKDIPNRLSPHSRSVGRTHSQTTIVRRKLFSTTQKEEGHDGRELILARRIQENSDAVEALRLQRQELDDQMVLLLGGEEVSSSHHRNRNESSKSRSRTHRPGDSPKGRSRHRSRLQERSRRRSRSQERSRHRSRSQERNRPRGRSQERRRPQASSDQKHRDRRMSSPRKSKSDVFARRLAELEQRFVGSDINKAASINSSSPFSPEIDRERAEPNKKAPHIESYDGSGDPYEHSQAYERVMNYYDYSDAAKCQIFITTLKKDARQWMTSLAPNSISSWKELCDKFHIRFGSNKRRGKPTGSLVQVKQHSNESLGRYVKRFREAVGQVTDLNDTQALGYFQMGLDIVRSKKLVKDLIFNHPKDLAEAFDRAEGFITVEEAMDSLKPNAVEKPREQDRSNYTKSNNRMESQPRKSFNGESGASRPSFPNRGVNKIYTPLNTSRAEILEKIKDKPYFEPCSNNTRPWRGNPSRYCNYHQTSGHSTEDCWNLKDIIEKNVRSGELVQYVAGRDASGGGQHNQEQNPRPQAGQIPPARPVVD